MAASQDHFMTAANELLWQLEGSLLALGTEADWHMLDLAMTAVQQLGEAAAMHHHTELADFTLQIEHLLAVMRVARIQASDALVTLLLQAHDQLHRLVEAAGGTIPEDALDEGARLASLLRQRAAAPPL